MFKFRGGMLITGGPEPPTLSLHGRYFKTAAHLPPSLLAGRKKKKKKKNCKKIKH